MVNRDDRRRDVSTEVNLDTGVIQPHSHEYTYDISASAPLLQPSKSLGNIVAPPGPSFLCFKKNEEAEFENTPSSSDLQHTTDTNAM